MLHVFLQVFYATYRKLFLRQFVSYISGFQHECQLLSFTVIYTKGQSFTYFSTLPKNSMIHPDTKSTYFQKCCWFPSKCRQNLAPNQHSCWNVRLKLLHWKTFRCTIKWWHNWRHISIRKVQKLTAEREWGNFTTLFMWSHLWETLFWPPSVVYIFTQCTCIVGSLSVPVVVSG